ncbi:conserved protein [Clostridium tetani E88]|uniref:Conserved protein n=2 Tax=Clostridium tetani TaxID=1513 RepID=Q897M9_CLOTE|nr:conserved protein [Clostridium tetani E88]
MVICMKYIKTKCSKSLRVLTIYERLSTGGIINKKELAYEFGVDEKSIQRDINDLRAYFQECYKEDVRIKYCRSRKGYILEKDKFSYLNYKEITAITKILLDSRAFNKKEMSLLLNKVILQCIPGERENIKNILNKEVYNYVELQHGKKLIDILLDIEECIRKRKYINIKYKRVDKSLINRKLKPIGLIFNKFYFYLIAYIESKEEDFIATYRVDRIEEYKIFEEYFYISQKNRFEEGEFRKKMQFMSSGGLINIKFYYWGPSLELVLDRLPTAEVIGEENNKYLIKANVLGKGIITWLLSQKNFLEVLEPFEIRNEIKNIIKDMLNIYI